MPLTSTLGSNLSDEFLDGNLLQTFLTNDLLAVLLELISPTALGQLLSQHLLQFVLLASLN